MGLPAVTKRMTSEEYLAWEALQPDKHEYVDGEVFQVHVMVGASRRHVTVAGNLFSELSRMLEGGPCRAYMSDMKLQVLAANAWFYSVWKFPGSGCSGTRIDTRRKLQPR